MPGCANTASFNLDLEQAAAWPTTLVTPTGCCPYVHTEYVWSDQYDWKFQIAWRPG